MHPCDSTALAKKNRPGRHVWSSTWCFWIVHGHVQTKSGFQLLCEDGRFSQIWSFMVNLFILINVYLSFYSGVSFSDRRIDPGYQPTDGEIKAFVFEILQKEMPSQLDSFKEDLEVYFKNVSMCT